MVITGEIDLSLPVDHGARHGRVLPRRDPGGRAAAAGARWPAFATGAVCGWINGALISRLNIPSLVITIGTSFLFRGLELVLMNGTGVPLTADKFPALQAMFREPLFGVLPVQTRVDGGARRVICGCCSTAPASAPMSSWSATTRPAPG